MRILVIYPQKGFLDLVKRVLAETHEVEVCADYAAATGLLAGEKVYEAVLCGLAEPVDSIRILEAALAAYPQTRIIVIATAQAEVDALRKDWNGNPAREAVHSGMGDEWLRLPCTVPEILRLLGATRVPPTPPRTPTSPVEPTAIAIEGSEQLAIAAGKPRAGAIVDGYRLVCLIGHGGFGTMWLGVNETTGKRVAVKFVEGEEQVAQELVALRKYVHVAPRSPDLIQVEHINSDEVRLWLVTPLADSLTGSDTTDAYKALSLANQIAARGHLPEQQAVRIALNVVRGLLALHQTGLLHGDVASGNILSVRGRWVLADPGLVRFLREPGICRNQRYYPSPQPVLACDDLYAVGVVLWDATSGVAEMVSGQDRLRLDSHMVQFLLKHELPLVKIICRAVAEDPNQRYLNAEEMLHDLEAADSRLTSEPTPQYSIYNLTKLRTLRTNGAMPPLAADSSTTT